MSASTPASLTRICSASTNPDHTFYDSTTAASVLVSDLEKSATFYKTLFGLSLLSEDKEHGILRLGTNHVIVSIRKEQPYGTVDHFGVRVENFNKGALTQTLKQHGLAPEENWQYGFYLKDPDGVNVQLV
jgi:catechol-2,3-dioxygenase